MSQKSEILLNDTGITLEIKPPGYNLIRNARDPIYIETNKDVQGGGIVAHDYDSLQVTYVRSNKVQARSEF